MLCNPGTVAVRNNRSRSEEAIWPSRGENFPEDGEEIPLRELSAPNLWYKDRGISFELSTNKDLHELIVSFANE